MSKPKAVIVDMDGTLVNVNSIRHHVIKDHPLNETGKKDFKAFHSLSTNCPPNPDVMELVEQKAKTHKILIVTGRSDEYRFQTENWLEDQMEIEYEGPFMRKSGDFRKDFVIKEDIYWELAKEYDIEMAIDDNPAIIELWEKLDLEVHVVEGWMTTA